MKPCDEFPHATKILTRPAEMTDEECGSLAVWEGDSMLVSRWKMRWRERLSALVYGTVWIWVYTRTGTQPPISIEATKNIFHVVKGPSDGARETP